VKKASSFPLDKSMELELTLINKETYSQNLFLKARVDAFVKTLNKSTSMVELQKPNKFDENEEDIFEETDRVTFKKIS
jgi:hypothetical protein